MAQSGWVKMHRSMLDWEWYSDINVCRLFTHMILKANHKDNKWRGILIKRGQTLTSLNTLESETGLSKSQIRTAVKKLISTLEIAQQSHSQHTVFTVVNYDSYQGDDTHNDTPVASQSHTSDTRVTPNKNDKNENNENKHIYQSKIARDELIESSFDYWWKAYPTKTARKAAFKKWESITKKMDDNIVTELTNHIVADIAFRLDGLANGDDRFIGFNRLHPSTYLNQERYNDDF